MAAALAGLATAAPADAQGPPAGVDAYFDSRDRERASGRSAPKPPPATRRARRALVRSLGPRAVLDVDALSGTPRVLARLDGTLTGPRRGDPVDLAQRYVRRHLAALGLTDADLGSFGDLRRVRLPGGGHQVRWRQFHDGVPAFDGELRLTVADGGEIVNVLGSPRHDLEPAPAAPRLGAGDALRAAGATGAPRRVSGPSGPRRATRFAGGHEAALVVFGSRLAWRVIHRASSQAVWDVVVDAGTGRVLRRANQVKSFDFIDVFERHPGASAVDSYDFVDEGWLPLGATTLDGPSARAWSDADDSNTVTADEEVVPGNYAQQTFPCPLGPCTWDSDDLDSWQVNREQGTVQAFYYVNRFHDWLRDLGFVDGAMEGGDRVLVHTFDGAGLRPQPRNNANMLTPPDGSPPVMQLYLFDTRDVHGGDDAAIVYHEYAHGLTDRLVTDGDGWGALTSPQAAAMGEGWSDYFAMDFLVERGHEIDDPGPGDVDLDAYTQGAGRRQALDCPVLTPAAGCDDGGFTYADFGAIAGVPEVHADGEIWGQTLWDLRGGLIPDSPSDSAAAARELVFAALSLAPPEPSFLDMRNAILLADVMVNDGANEDAIWDVFTGRGMGWYASTNGSSDVNPAGAFEEPSGTPGSVAGRVIDADNRRPIAGAVVRVGGHDTHGRDGSPLPGGFLATTGASGAFTLGPLPSGTYEGIIASAPDGHDPETLADVAVPRTGLDILLRRNWAAAASGGRVHGVGGVDVEYAGCRPEQAIDQLPGTGFSALNDGSPPVIVVRLPRLVSVTGFAADPGNACGDPAWSTTTRFAVAVSENGSTWYERQYALGLAAAHVRTPLPPPTAGTGRVRFVRLRMLEAAHPDAQYIDFTELSVYGNALPVAALAVPAAVGVGQPFTLDARGAQDPDGTIVQYRWDFDGDGTVDRATAAATTAFAYGTAGLRRPTVTVVDDRGGLASAAAAVTATAPPAPPPPELADPRIALPRKGRRARVRVGVTCEAACWGTLRLTVSRRTARRLRLGRARTIGRARVALPEAGRRRIAVKLSRKAVRRLERARRRAVRAKLSASVVDAGGRHTRARRIVRIRR